MEVYAVVCCVSSIRKMRFVCVCVCVCACVRVISIVLLVEDVSVLNQS